MIRKVVGVKDPILRQSAKKVVVVDKKILSIIEDLKDTLSNQKDPEGVGLAAPQIGKDLQIFLAKFKDIERVVINPEVMNISKFEKLPQKANGQLMEGCLSVPHYYSAITRAPKIKIKYLSIDNKEVVEEFNGFIAQIIQHEIDHLNGILFIDHVLKQKKPLYKYNGKTFEEVEL